MRFTTRTAVLAAALSLPLCAALASYALAADPPDPNVPSGVEIGESTSVGERAGTVTPPPSTTTTPPPKPAPPATKVVPPAPPVIDDDQGDDDGDGDDGGDDDDGDGDGDGDD